MYFDTCHFNNDTGEYSCFWYPVSDYQVNALKYLFQSANFTEHDLSYQCIASGLLYNYKTEKDDDGMKNQTLPTISVCFKSFNILLRMACLIGIASLHGCGFATLEEGAINGLKTNQDKAENVTVISEGQATTVKTGMTLNKGDEIESGPEITATQCTVPDLKNLHPSKALNLLEHSKFKGRIRGTSRSASRVTSQSPRAGRRVNCESTITIYTQEKAIDRPFAYPMIKFPQPVN